MNKTIKNVLTLVSLLAGTVFIAAILNAATLSTTIAGAGTNSIVTRPCSISQMVFVNGGTQTVTLKLFDAPLTSLTYTGGTYTNMVLTSTYFTNQYTGLNGTAVSNVFQVVSNVATVVAAYTNAYPTLATVLVPTNSTVTYTPSAAVIATRGVLMTNLDTVSVSISYTPNF